MKDKLILLVLLIFLIGCNNESTTNCEEEIIVDLKKEIESIHRKNVFTYEKLIRLDTLESSLISKVSKVFIDDDRYFVLDTRLKTVFQFNNEGKFISKLESIGNGPDEYLSILDINIEKDTKTYLVLDNSRKRILRYTYDNEFIKAFKMDNLNVGAVHHFEKVSENIIALYARFDASHITIYDLNHQKIIAKSISVPNVLHKSLIPVDYNYSNFFHIGNKLCYFERWDQTIYEIDTSRIVPKFRVEFSDMNFLDITKITNGKDYKKNFWEWYNGDWVRGLDVVSCIDGNLIIEFSYLKERYTAIYDTSNKGLELFKFNDLDILSKSKYKTSYINHSNKIILTYDIVEQEEVIRYLEKNFNSNLEMNLNPYILQLCLKK